MKALACIPLLLGIGLVHAESAPAPLTQLAIVTEDGVALRAEARHSAAPHAVLWQGENLEVRGRSLDYLQVYDHRIERAGFVRASAVHIISTQPDDAAELLAVARFLRDIPGNESLGIAYTAAYLKAAPAKEITAEPFDALGVMASHLAERVSTNRSKAQEPVLSGQLEVAAGYGVAINSINRNGRMRLCYDGDAFRRVMALDATAMQKATAALALTTSECMAPDQPPVQRDAFDSWRAELLDRVPRTDLPRYVQNRLHMRAASIWSAIAYERTRRNESAQQAASRALDELAAVDTHALIESDRAEYNDAATRVGASRWAAAPLVKPNTGLHIVTAVGQPGETCIKLLDGQHDESKPLAQRCTYGTVWASSARANANGTALALAVQPMTSWRELWLFHRVNKQWTIDVLPPANDDPGLGYIEFAGWVPGDHVLLAAREARVNGRFVHRFEIIDMATLATTHYADKPSSLSLFYRHQDALWKGGTVSLRN
ncbi:hypothetical protein PY254_12000 [Rhodanobacter sp. AS-Z3]|uniref:hypothetical protein n=1 Tax=Rhodanobacter sp. AS-Z3 TaxID=3031330 RepID=UPI0024786096|nr:hypothetical protein [Rhodanobacter sp. AS-Z3]WEN13960.1 hypothetical protein PY254_12000 [Rhodanobacter sp. AS-Z3]